MEKVIGQLIADFVFFHRSVDSVLFKDDSRYAL